MLLMEEILRVYRMVNPSCTATPISASSSPQKDLKDIVPAVDAQELSQSLIENMNRAFNCITNTKHPTSNQTVVILWLCSIDYTSSSAMRITRAITEHVRGSASTSRYNERESIHSKITWAPNQRVWTNAENLDTLTLTGQRVQILT